jgi:hypothetical protein
MDRTALENSLKRSKGKKVAVYVDDNRTPTETHEGYQWVIVRSYDEFTWFITQYYKKYKELPKLISLDHDLTPEYIHYYFEHPGERIVDYSGFITKSGYHCLVWFVITMDSNGVSFEDTLFAVHSHNELGKKNLMQYLQIAKESRYGKGKANSFEKDWEFTYNQEVLQKQQKSYNNGDKKGTKDISQERKGGTSLIITDT